MGFTTVAKADQFEDGDRIVADVGEMYVAIFKVDGKFYAIEDVCTHDDGPLAEGDLHTNGTPEIECPRHGAHFNLETGKPTFPAVVPVDRFPIRVEGDDVQIDLDNPL